MKPYIVCHMMASVDGRIDCAMTQQIESGNEYYEALNELDCPASLMGRVTMQMHYAAPEPFIAESATPIGRQAEHVAQKADNYIVAVDTHGKLCWPAKEFDGQPLLVITSEECSTEYLHTLDRQGISWIAAGRTRIDLPKAMEILRETFGIERMAVVGGGNINGAFLEAELLDEVSLMIAPGIDGRTGMTAVFDGICDLKRPATKLELMSVKQVGEGTVWIRYRFPAEERFTIRS